MTSPHDSSSFLSDLQHKRVRVSSNADLQNDSTAATSTDEFDHIVQSRPPVLVTGAAGFIGSHTAHALLKRGETVIILDELNDYYDIAVKKQNLQLLIDEFGTNRVRVYIGDICDSKLLAQIYDKEKFDRIVHLAARAGVRPSLEQPQLYIQANIVGTMALLELCRQINQDTPGYLKHFVYASSSSVYGDNLPVPFSELEACNSPVSPYAASKKSCESFASCHASTYKIPCSGLRFFTVYGPRGRPDMAPYKFIKQVYHGETIQQFGDGTTERDYTYVSDIVSGIIRCLDRPPHTITFDKPPAVPSSSPDSKVSYHEVYNLGRGDPCKLNEFISTISNLLNKKPNIKICPMQPGDVQRTYADIRKAQEYLGYSPKVSVQEGLRRTAEWYKAEMDKLNQRKQLEQQMTTTMPISAPVTPMNSDNTSDNTTVDTNSITSTISNIEITSVHPTPSSENRPITSIVSPSTSSSSSNDISLDTLKPLPGVLAATRIHNQGSSRIGITSDTVAHIMTWLPRALASTEYVAIAVDTTDGRSDVYDGVKKVVDSVLASLPKSISHSRVQLVKVSPWGAFIPALNALLAHAQKISAHNILYSSIEMKMHPLHIRTLAHHLTDETLVVGARLPGHQFMPSTLQQSNSSFSRLDGSSTVWNTLALWNTTRLARTGFLSVSDGLPEMQGRPAVPGGVEEVAVISLQQKLYPRCAVAKLLSIDCDTDDLVTAELTCPHSPNNVAFVDSIEDQQEELPHRIRNNNITSVEATHSCPSSSSSAYPQSVIASSSSQEKQDWERRAQFWHHGEWLAPTNNTAVVPCSGSSQPIRKSSMNGKKGVSTILPALLNQLSLFYGLDMSLNDLHWDSEWRDVERRKLHEYKMNSKKERAALQMQHLKLEPGWIQHIQVKVTP